MKSSLDYLIKQSKKYPVLTREQEIELHNRFTAGDPLGKELLVNSNIRFVVQRAHTFRQYTKRVNVTLEDLVQEGMIALGRAVDKFDPGKGYRFITYAVWWINAHMRNYIMANFHTMKFGTTTKGRALFFKSGAVREIMEMQDADEKYQARVELAEKCGSGITVEDIAAYEHKLYDLSQLSLDSHMEDGDYYYSVIPAQQPGAFTLAAKKQLAKKVRDVLLNSELTARELDIVRQRFLISETKTLQSIANEYGISRERVRQIEGKALRKLRANMVQNGVSEKVAAA